MKRFLLSSVSAKICEPFFFVHIAHDIVHLFGKPGSFKIIDSASLVSRMPDFFMVLLMFLIHCQYAASRLSSFFYQFEGSFHLFPSNTNL